MICEIKIYWMSVPIDGKDEDSKIGLLDWDDIWIMKRSVMTWHSELLFNENFFAHKIRNIKIQ